LNSGQTIADFNGHPLTANVRFGWKAVIQPPIRRVGYTSEDGSKQNATIVIVPSTAVESMQLGGIAGVTALTKLLGQDRNRIPPDSASSSG